MYGLIGPGWLRHAGAAVGVDRDRSGTAGYPGVPGSCLGLGETRGSSLKAAEAVEGLTVNLG